MIDSILKFPDEPTAMAALTGHVIAGAWMMDHVVPVTVTRISTGLPIAGFTVLIALTNDQAAKLAFLRNHAAVQLVIDRDKAAARQAGAVIKSTVGGAILQDIVVSPAFAGSDYPWGGL